MSEKIDREKILERVRALFALGDTSRNNSEAEASTALKKAQELLQKHNLDISEVEVSSEARMGIDIVDEVSVEWRKSSMSTWEGSLAAMVGMACECKPYIEKGWVPGTKSGKIFKIRFVGAPWDVAISKEMFMYLHKTIKKLSVKNFPESLPSQRSYMEGCCHRLGERIREQNKRFKQEQQTNEKYALLIINKKDAIDKYCEDHLKLSAPKASKLGKGEFDQFAFMKGMSDGSKFDIGNEKRIKGEETEQGQLV